MTKRILHIVGGMNRGGIETWLMHVLRHIDRDRFRMDFLVHTTEACAYDDEIRALGSQIIPCMHPSRPIAYARNFRRILREYGPYDVVHSHVHHYSGYVLWLAAQASVPVRIAHSHTGGKRDTGLLRNIYIALTRNLIWRYATHGIGISENAADSLFGLSWSTHEKMRIIYYGFDFSSFNTGRSRAELKEQLAIPHTRYVLGHVGRFMPVKNHTFILDLFEALVAQHLDIHLLLVGDGPLYKEIQERINKTEQTMSRCTLVGVQSITAPYLGAMDLFLFPSLYEGLGIVVLEAQASGVPSIISSVVPHEVDVIPDLITRIHLDDGVNQWVDAICNFYRMKTNRQPNTVDVLAKSPFGIEKCLRSIEKVYLSSLR